MARLGMHYARTGEAWLARLDENVEVAPRLGIRFLASWRVSLIAFAELGGYRGGCEWFVSRYLLK